MLVVFDTNILLVSVSRHSPHQWLFRAIEYGEIDFAVTTEILAEYEEIIGRHMGEHAANAALEVFTNTKSVRHITTYFQFNLLLDKDDNKFVDCAIASGADFIVTHDRDFKRLAQIEFPTVRIISLADLKAWFFNK